MTAQGSQSPRPDRLLIVEDDATFGDIIERYLSARGLDVVRRVSTEDAIAALGTGADPDLILLDINLPGDTGWGLLRHDAYHAAGRPPVLVVSATSVSAGRLAEFGVAGYLPKPFPLQTLVDTVERLLHPMPERAEP